MSRERSSTSIPPIVLANWTGWAPDDVARIAADAVARRAAAIAAWGLTELTEMAGGEVALVSAARRPDGREVVLKVSPEMGEATLAAESIALLRWARTTAAPEVLGVRDGGLTLLLARVLPGHSLRDTGAGAGEIIDTIARLLSRVHLLPEPGDALPTLAEHAREDGWFQALEGTAHHDELTRLTAPSEADRLLHLDLHWLNVLRDADAGWLVIDPKPAIGDPHADVWAFCDGPPLRELPADPATARRWIARLVDEYATTAGLDPGRVGAWIRLRAHVVIAQIADDGDAWAGRFARLVAALDR